MASSKPKRNLRPAPASHLYVRAFLALLVFPQACSEPEERAEVASPLALAVCDAESPSWPGAHPEQLAAIPNHPLPMLAALDVPALELVGRHDSALSVGGGAAHYSIELPVPPGRVGLAPDLSLRYSSSGGNGAAGVGWSATGSPRIHRCPQTSMHDGRVRPIQIDDEDRLCLDGERLVLVAGTYGSQGAEYRSEIDKLSRVRQLGTLDDPSACFTIEYKTQQTLTLGGCSDPTAVEMLPGSPTPWAWAASVRRDRRGNRLDYEYAVQGGQHLMMGARYTGFGETKGDRRIEYVWQARPDTSIRFVTGGELRTTQRLSAINTYVGASLVLHHELAYEVSAATRRSLLKTITTCTTDPCTSATSMPPTVIEYQNQVVDFTPEEVPTADPHRERVWLLVDYDGDGEKDILRVTHDEPWGSGGSSVLELSTGPVITEVELPVSVDHDDLPFRLGHRWDTDFDLDGRADIEGSVGGAWAIASWNDETGSFEARVSALSRPEFILERRDFDADGRPDLFSHDGQGNYTIHYQCEAAAPSQISFCRSTSVPLHLATCERLAHVSDLDGNGYPDFVVDEMPGPGSCTGGSHSLPYVLWMGAEQNTPYFVVTSLAQVGGPGTLTGTNGAIRWMDINGDGMDDLLDFPSAAWLNRGGTFTSMPVDGASLGIHPNRYGAVRVGDFDHDGRDEILFPAQAEGEWCYLTWANSLEPLEYCTTGALNFDASNAPSHLDRSLYRWDLLDLEVDVALGAIVRSIERRAWSRP